MPSRRPHALPVALVLALLLLVTARMLSGDGGEPAPVEIRGPGDAAPGSRDGGLDAGADGDAGAVWVHVAGRVRRPGLLRLRSGARVADAIDAAGGAARGADLAGVNLAAPLVDGGQVLVPVRGRPSAERPGAGEARGALSLSSATQEQLEELDGIGPALARRIVEARTARGGFSSIDELLEVEGIGEKRLAALRDALTP